jgi:1-acyl-sn-glycerol-3-phosphate acyltransferase
LWIVGIRYRVEGAEHIQRRPAIYCVNHASNVEPPIIFVVLRRLMPKLLIIYKAELRKIPILTQGFDLVGFVPVDRGNRDHNSRALAIRSSSFPREREAGRVNCCPSRRAPLRWRCERRSPWCLSRSPARGRPCGRAVPSSIR